jgi:acetoacetyl-CoA synthetase
VRVGVRSGDSVAAVLPNALEALVSFLATASLGATWTSGSPESEADAILDRFRQLSPAVSIAVGRYRHGGYVLDRR